MGVGLSPDRIADSAEISRGFRSKPAGHSDDASRVCGGGRERVDLSYWAVASSSFALADMLP
jgi:hypothetical protein